MSIFFPNYVKNCKNGGFLKTTIVTVREKVFLTFFHYLEANTTHAGTKLKRIT